MSDFMHREEERVTRQQAAERLIDLAYALTAGGPLELGPAGRRVTVAVGGELHLERGLRAKGDRVALELELSWATPER